MKDMKSKSSDTVLIFGYGSLMSHRSLRADAPDATNIRPAYIKGFRREFSKLDPEGLSGNSPEELAGIPYCAVDIITDKAGGLVNGVVFEANAADLAALKRRENGYALVSTPAYDFMTGQPLGNCFVFSSNACDGSYELGNPAQKRYVDICLEGAREYGDAFYRQFLMT
ncbi:MAG TPA: gamma-glutamylcyclotransferase family protein, partial [Candidatus Saccharimonadales bacterium]|nr:gamma-glutamylcyclotransferase family protein [Candidatus Saccharimonadales bacterium]